MIGSFNKLYWANQEMALASITQRIPCYLHPTTLSSTLELFSALLPQGRIILPLVKPQYKTSYLSRVHLWSMYKKERFVRI